MLGIMNFLSAIVVIFLLISGIIAFGPQTETVLDAPEIEIEKIETQTDANQPSLIQSIVDFLIPPSTRKTTPKATSPSSKTSPSTSTPRETIETTEPIEQKITGEIDTFITSGPKEGEVIKETNQVTFKFEGKLLDSDDESRITFQTKILNIDDDWKSTSNNKRTITLPAGSKEYTFLVRAKTKDLTDQTPAERKFQINVSPYFRKIKIYSIKIRGSTPALVVLSTNLSSGEKINIANWQIKSKTKTSTIQGGIEKYYPNQGAASDSIYVSRNHKVYISGGFNPLGSNRNFRINKCMGYLENYNDFPINIPTSCPKPTSKEISHLGYYCQKFINSSSRCTIPNSSSEKNLMYDYECASYIQGYFNYAACFNQYEKDSNFLQNSWHIYLNSINMLTGSDTCDTLYLKDSNGLFVDKRSYGNLCI